MTDFGFVIGIIASIMSLSAFSLQLLKSLKTKNTKALSYNLMIWVGIAMVLFVGYGISINEPVIYIGNIIGALLNLSLIVFKRQNEKNHNVS